MAYSDAIVQRARARLDADRQKHDRESEERVTAVYERLPRLREIDLELRRTVAQVMAITFERGEDPTEAMARLKEDNLALQRERDWILESEGLDEQDVRMEPICPTCKGLGFVGERLCDCLQELCRQEQKKELSGLIGSSKSAFETFNLLKYPDVIDASIGKSPREVMRKTFDFCKEYAVSFSKKSPSLLFSGGTGLGKTFLSAAIAKVAAEKGYAVCYETAITVFGNFEAEKFEKNTQRDTKRYLTCDLLILDDLGTEMTTQFTQSVLYSVINSRMLSNLPTIVSTNLNDREIQARYSPQIFSRLLGAYVRKPFVGNDIRMVKD